MDQEIDKILSAVEKQKREIQKTEDRGQKFHSDRDVRELIKNTRRDLKEIESAVADCGPFFARVDRLGLRHQLDCRMWLEYYEVASGKVAAIPVALQWLENLTERDFAQHYTNNYPWRDTVRVFITEFLTNQNGDGRGVARGIRDKHQLLESWIQRNAAKLMAKTETPIMPPDRTPPHRTLNNLDEEP
jgi:hypothetical protein